MLPLLNRPYSLLIGIFNTLQSEMQLSQEKLTHKLNIYLILREFYQAKGSYRKFFRKLGQCKVFIRNDYIRVSEIIF